MKRKIYSAMLGFEDYCFSLCVDCLENDKKNNEIFQVLNQAIDRKEAWANYVYGLYYDNHPKSSLKNKHKAYEYFFTAAELGHAKSIYEVGMYFDFIKSDKKKARHWYLKGVKSKNGACCYSLANMYYLGDGVRKSMKKAFKYYTLSAFYGDRDGMLQLGYMLYEGEGVEKNVEDAVSWYRVSAENGCDEAMYNLGLCYENGECVQQSDIIALAFYKEASSCGNKKAKQKVKQFKKSNWPTQK